MGRADFGGKLGHGSRSEIELELNRDKLSKDAVRRSNADPYRKSRLTPHPDDGMAVPRTETYLTVKLAKKRPLSKRSKKSLDGLYEVLALGSSVIKTDAYTSVINEPGKREVTIRNSDLANLGQRQNAKQTYNSTLIGGRKYRQGR